MLAKARGKEDEVNAGATRAQEARGEVAARAVQKEDDRYTSKEDTRVTERAEDSAATIEAARLKNQGVDRRALTKATALASANASKPISTFEMVDKDGNTIEAVSMREGVMTPTGEPIDERIYSRRRSGSGDDEVFTETEEMPISERRMAAIDAKGSATERGKAQLLVSVGEQLNQLVPQGNTMIEEGRTYPRWKEYAGDVAKILTPDGLEDPVSNMMNEVVYTDEQNNYIGNLANAIGDLRKSRTGANVTLIETELGKNWDPSVKGITLQERVRRASELQGFINTNLDVMGIEGFDVTPAFAPGVTKGAESEADELDAQIRALEKELEEEAEL
jgi:hypothetical protein